MPCVTFHEAEIASYCPTRQQLRTKSGDCLTPASCRRFSRALVISARPSPRRKSLPSRASSALYGHSGAPTTIPQPLAAPGFTSAPPSASVHCVPHHCATKFTGAWETLTRPFALSQAHAWKPSPTPNSLRPNSFSVLSQNCDSPANGSGTALAFSLINERGG